MYCYSSYDERRVAETTALLKPVKVMYNHASKVRRSSIAMLPSIDGSSYDLSPSQQTSPFAIPKLESDAKKEGLA